MKKEDFVKLGVTEDVAEILEKEWAELTKDMIPRSRFNEVNEAKKSLADTLKERDEQLEKLKNSSGETENLKEQIAQMQEANKAKQAEHEAEIKRLKIDNALNSALAIAKAKNSTAVRALLKIENAELDDKGNIVGLKEQIKALQKSDSYLFDVEKAPTLQGTTPAAGSDEKPKGITQEQFNRMTYKERDKLFKENIDLYNQFTERN